MKNYQIIFNAVLLSLLTFSCGEKVVADNHDSAKKAFVNYPDSNHDTINRIDASGLRQGFWIFVGREKKDPAFPLDAIWQEGNYSNGRKEGLWKEYESTGMVKTMYNYQDDKIIDILLSENSQGKYKAMNFIDANGLREGWWMISGLMQKDPAYAVDSKFSEGLYVLGKEEGEWVFYYPNGSVKKKVNYKAGVEMK